MIRKASLTLAVAGALAVVGCGPRHSEGDASDRGMTHVDHIGGKEIEEAARDMAKKISEKNANGWPAHIVMSTDTPPKPQLRIGDITYSDHLTVRVDVQSLKDELMNVLTEQGVCYVINYRENTDATMDEREYQQAMGAANAVPSTGTEDATGLILEGTIADDVIEIDGEKQHDYWFSLKLIDTVKQRVVVTTRTKMRRIRD